MLRKMNVFSPFERLNISNLEFWFQMSGLSLARYLMEPLVLNENYETTGT